jgi:CBS domain containing-hemolysin-like protein
VIAQAWQQTDWILLGTVVVLLSLSGFLALAETALVRMTRSKAAALADDKRRGSQAVLRLSASPDEFLNPLLLLILVCQLVSATSSAPRASWWRP